MNVSKLDRYKKYTWFVFYAILFVILAGGTVRMTQSGMGCPDWPRCFGKWIPPLNVSQLPADFETYLSKQDIDHSFNAYHTWIEYINRLSGALLGIFVFIYLIWTVRLRKLLNRSYIWVAVMLFLLTGFQGWLGKLVVEGNLAVSKITIHMLVAIIILCLPIINIRSFDKKKISVTLLKKYLPLGLILLVIGQIILGTQVREEVDLVSKSLNYLHRDQWIEGLSNIFIIHRSFSWILIISTGIMVYIFKQNIQIKKDVLFIAILTLFNMFVGIIMSYMDMPAIAQPMHLLGACLLVVIIFNFYLKLRNTNI